MATLFTRSSLALARSARRGLSTESSSSSSSVYAKFWAWTTQSRPSWKESPTEAAVAFVVFGITGSSSVHLVRPALKSTIGLEGSMRDGPWSYRITSILAVSPIYATLLVTFGTVAGRHRFFARMASNIFGRFLPNAVIRRVADSFAWCFPRSVMK